LHESVRRKFRQFNTNPTVGLYAIQQQPMKMKRGLRGSVPLYLKDWCPSCYSSYL